MKPPPRRDDVLLWDGVTLRAPRRRDYATWAEMALRNAENLRPWQPRWPKDYLTERAYRRRMRLYDTERSLGTGFAYHAYADDVLIGVCRLAPVRYGSALTGSLGYWTDEAFRGRGYATGMVMAVKAFAFETVGLERIEAAHLPQNVASARVLEKAGFTEEGLARRYLEVDGQRRDHRLTACLRGDGAGGPDER